MTKISVDEELLRTAKEALEFVSDFTSAEAIEKLLPADLPTEIGTVIMWRENNDAGEGVGVFAERVHVDGKNQWRRNGFDLYPDSSMKYSLAGEDWWIMERKV